MLLKLYWACISLNSHEVLSHLLCSLYIIIDNVILCSQRVKQDKNC